MIGYPTVAPNPEIVPLVYTVAVIENDDVKIPAWFTYQPQYRFRAVVEPESLFAMFELPYGGMT